MRIHLVYAGSPDSESIQSPYSITKNLYYYLKARAHVMYHDWTSRATIEALSNDIVIGHPNYDSDTIISKFFRSGQKCKAKCLIHPLHTVRIQDNLPFDPLARAADKIFWSCYGTDNYKALPPKVLAFIDRIEKVAQIPVTVVGTGPQINHVCYRM